MFVSLVICREFGRGDDANTWRKLTQEADKDFLLQLRKQSFATSPYELTPNY